MRSLITYYSFSGNTDRVAKVFANILSEKSEVVLQRLKPKNEITKFGAQCRAAFMKKRAILENGISFDASSYDLFLIGSPVWAFAPTPAINTYLDKLSGLKGKRAIILLTSGSGVGVKGCFKNIRKVLQEKEASRIDEINIPDRHQDDNDFIASSLKNIL